MAKKRATLTDLLNDLTYRMHFDRNRLVCLNAHEWSGLPEGIEPRHIEKWLFSNGYCAFFKRKKGSFMVLECSSDGRQNVYGDPTGYRITGVNYQTHRPADKCVIIKNNLLALPTEPFVIHYVNKITEAERTMDVNIKACKTPVVFACDDKDVMTFKRIFQQVDGNVPAIFADRGLNLESIQAFMTGVKFMGNELMDYKRSVESDLLTFLGQNNTPIDKKERLITDEAQANDQLIQSFADLQLEAREKACEEINEMFDLNISVRRREPVEKAVDTVEEEGDHVPA
ncbi:MAG: hypothetical protein J6J12_00200 [Oscillospiraceae bacterium]|nr:hypothetical protein [Oscillospiraceae bacterium]